MKKTCVDRLGRIVIPINMRRALGIDGDSEVNVEMSDGKIIITPCNKLCKICGRVVNNELPIAVCFKCLDMIKRI